MVKDRKLFLLIALIVILDQIAKYFARQIAHPIDFGFFEFSLVKNTGSLFGMMQNLNGIFIWLSLIAIGLLLFYYPEFKNFKTKLAISIILSGILGNLIDRIFLGYVTDFINFRFWPVFNIADSCLTVGIILILFSELFQGQGRVRYTRKK